MTLDRRATHRLSNTGRWPIGVGSFRVVEVIWILVAVIVVLLLAGTLVGLAFELFWLAVGGVIIGALGRLVLPGRQEIGMLATALVGIAASLLGGILANLFDAGWIVRLLVAVALAAIGVTLLESKERGSGGLDSTSPR
jgi:uncharacterized membrane protein YeaQ/YmgE (transglycosylase-associated protein family)